MSMRVQRKLLGLLIGILIIVLSCNAAWGLEQTEESSDNDLYEFLEKFHGHTCAGSLMGVRLGLAAKAALKRLGKIEGKLKARYFKHSCPVDGIQVVLGTTYGNRAIEVFDRGEYRLLLEDTKSKRQVEARLKDAAIAKGKYYRLLRKKIRKLPDESEERRGLEQETQAILKWFRSAPESAIVTVKTNADP